MRFFGAKDQHLKKLLDRSFRQSVNPSGNPDKLPDISLSNPAPPVFPLEVFGERWTGWIREVGEAAACPVDYVVAVLLPAASALIGHARWAEAWPGWQEPPHLWCASVGHSGQGKSPGADLIIRHVVPSIEARMVRDARFKEDVDVALWRSHTATFTANDVLPPSDLAGPFRAPRFMESDLTIEKVADVLANAAPKGLLMVRDELAGWLLGMNRFNAGARAFWLEAHGGRPYSLDRIKGTGRVYVPRLAVAWHGGVQPERLTKLLADADDGLLARFMWFWPEPVPFRRPKGAAPDIAFAIAAFERLSLLEIGPRSTARPSQVIGRPNQMFDGLSTGDASGAPIVVRLTEEAAARLETFACQIQDQQSQSSGLLSSALGKTRGLVLRLSLVLQYLHWAAQDGIASAPAEIGTEALHAAIKLTTEYLIPMARRLYGGVASSPEDQTVESLARWIVQTKASEVHVRHLQRRERLPGLTSAAEIHNACEALVRAGWLVPPPRGSNHGRAKQAYRVRPEW